MRFIAMTEDQAKWVAYQWKYKGAYSFFHDKDQPDVQMFLEVGKKNTRQYAAYDKDEIIGFIGVKLKEKTLEIAPGLNPELIGKGRGKEFLESCISFLHEETLDELHVYISKENQRAISVFEDVGFVKGSENEQQRIQMQYRY
ncbi:ribosomal-protein-alanine acetyltransferase [Bacillus sp. JCM 19046]|nr:ribosomal-protein-alanine acetyltransferase [Bacillus sp. JCM 19045]GAF15628.1 ribosomal-protein-alanine acetyltransferase [Bacillus sp. JCM 19046]